MNLGNSAWHAHCIEKVAILKGSANSGSIGIP
jgi:hypothetical protein